MADTPAALEDSAIKYKDPYVNIKEECIDDIELRSHCPVCQDGFHADDELRIHIRNLHPFLDIDKQEVKEELYSTGTAESSHLELKLDEAESQHDEGQELPMKIEDIVDYDHFPAVADEPEKIYSCDLCNVPITQCPHGKIPRRKRSYPCSKCNKRLSGITGLNNHLETHTGEKPFSCEICKSSFLRKESLKKHVKIHAQIREKPFSCKICGKSFSDNGALSRHLKIHTDQKGYYCDICEKNYSRLDNLNAHLRIHSGEKPFTCDKCRKSFTYKCSLTTHLRTHND